MIHSLSLGGRNSLEINSCAFIIRSLIKCKAMRWGRGSLCWSLNKKKEVGVGVGTCSGVYAEAQPHVGIVSTGREQLVTALAKLGKL